MIGRHMGRQSIIKVGTALLDDDAAGRLHAALFRATFVVPAWPVYAVPVLSAGSGQRALLRVSAMAGSGHEEPVGKNRRMSAPAESGRSECEIMHRLAER